MHVLIVQVVAAPRLPQKAVPATAPKDVALIIWGSKVTGDISLPLRFHASKEATRQHLGMRRKNKWSNDKLDAVDWEHLDLALKNKTNMALLRG